MAHEINNPLEVIVNNLNLVEKHVARVSSDEDFIIESERFDSTYGAIARIQHIVNKLNDLAQGTEYATRQYLPGTTMTDLGGGMPSPPTAPPRPRGTTRAIPSSPASASWWSTTTSASASRCAICSRRKAATCWWRRGAARASRSSTPRRSTWS